MKRFLLLLLLLPYCMAAQEVILVDRNLKAAMLPMPDGAVQRWAYRWFPVYVADLDSVIQVAESLVRLINESTAQEAVGQLWPAGHTRFAVNVQRTGSSYTYSIFVSTRLGDVGTTLDLVKRQSSSRRAVQQLLQFLDYLKNNRHLIERPSLSAALLQSPHSVSTPLH